MNRLFRRRDEEGVALITVIMLSMIATLFVTTTMYVAFHDQTSSAHNRSWGQALHVAESGVHEAIAYLQNSSGVVPSSTADRHHHRGHVPVPHRRPGAEPLPDRRGRHRRQRRRAPGQPPPARDHGAARLVQVRAVLAVGRDHQEQQPGLRRRLRRHLRRGLQQRLGARRRRTRRARPAARVGSGNVTAATGYIELDNNSVVEGDAWSGGYNSSGNGIDNGGSIGGDAKASSSTPGCPDDPSHTKYKITGGTVAGSATAWGTISSTVSRHQDPEHVHRRRPRARSIPSFTFNSANYPAATLHTYTFPTDYTAFNNYIAANKSNLSGHLLHHRWRLLVPGRPRRRDRDRRPHRDRHRRADRRSERHRRERHDRQAVVLASWYVRAGRPAARPTAATPATARSASRTTSRRARRA